MNLFFFRGHGNESCNLIGSSWVTVYISNFIAIFHKYTSFCPLGSIFKQTHRSLPQADLWILSFLSLKSL